MVNAVAEVVGLGTRIPSGSYLHIIYIRCKSVGGDAREQQYLYDLQQKYLNQNNCYLVLVAV